MKKIKVHIANFNQEDPFAYGNFLLKILKKYYEVILDDKNPEYLFFYEAVHDHVKYDCIKIFYTGENIHPNFNFADYAIGCDYMDFGDRYYRLPIYLVAQFYSSDELKSVDNDLIFSKHNEFTIDDLHKKTDFCSFVYSNYLGGKEREDIFNMLSQYKKVNSGGKFLNNIGGPVKNKPEFEMKHKFSIAFENSSNLGYTTEKLPNALLAKTIPIYWGNPLVGKEFNEKRFINCHDFDSFDDVLKLVKELDQNDDKYLAMINQPIISTYDFNVALLDFEKFLRNIIDQPLEKAKRIRINKVRESDLKRSELIVDSYLKRNLRKTKLAALLYKPFKKVKFIDRYKQKILQKIKLG